MEVFDQSLNRLSTDGLNGVVQLLRERLNRGLAVLQSPEMGRQPASPVTENQLICIGVISLLAAGMLVVCSFAPFCWCCAGYFILAWAALAIAACLAS
jgi:hypothetical protein